MYTQESTRAAARGLIDAIPDVVEEFRCPICKKASASYDSLRRHYDECHQEDIPPMMVALTLNGRHTELLVPQHWSLQRALQFKLGLTGAKHMCDKGVCGSCTVIIDGSPALSCTTLVVECHGKDILTVEGIAADATWKPLVDAYCRWDAMQCGYCTPGFLVTAKALLDRNPNPTIEECNEALAGNICICGTYPRHATAIVEAALKIAEDSQAKGGAA
ncbi:MAG: (2Fe-2S)-binding protein [Oscillospiraceae bacterium]|nr:(2Fe-2S)-binding protein [Oscillospiraceae bacterium]